MSNLSVFAFESQQVRFVGTAEKPEWVAADVCAIFEIKNVSDALTSFDEDERGIANVYTPGDDNPKGQEMLTVTEAGLYRLIFKSRKPVAKRFQRWVFHEVLPSLRRTGKYEMPKPDQQQNTKLTLDELLNFGQKVLAGTRLSFNSSSPALYPKGERRVECEQVDDSLPTNAVRRERKTWRKRANLPYSRRVRFDFQCIDAAPRQ
jgi:prophage antirepressor-like protein